MVMARSRTPATAAIRPTISTMSGRRVGSPPVSRNLRKPTLHRGPRHGLDLRGGEQLRRRDEGQPAQGHAVDAPQVAVVDDRDAQVVDLAAEAVPGHPVAIDAYARFASVPALTSARMRVRVRLFASLREAVGRSEVELELPGARRRGRLAALVAERPALAARRASLAVAVNRSYAPFDARSGRRRRGRLHPARERRLSRHSTALRTTLAPHARRKDVRPAPDSAAAHRRESSRLAPERARSRPSPRHRRPPHVALSSEHRWPSRGRSSRRAGAGAGHHQGRGGSDRPRAIRIGPWTIKPRRGRKARPATRRTDPVARQASPGSETRRTAVRGATEGRPAGPRPAAVPRRPGTRPRAGPGPAWAAASRRGTSGGRRPSARPGRPGGPPRGTGAGPGRPPPTRRRSTSAANRDVGPQGEIAMEWDGRASAAVSGDARH